MANIAYFFEYQYASGRTATDYVQPALDNVRQWRENQGA
jgi:hypothetical protein